MRLIHQENTDIRLFVPKTLDFPLHLHNVVEIAFVTGGSATAICGDQRVFLEAGDVFIAFPNQEHSYENTQNVTGYVMIVPASCLTAFHSIFEQKVPVQPVLKKGQWEHTGILQLLDMAFSEWRTASRAMMHGYALLVVSKLMPLLQLKNAPSRGTAALQSLLLYINQHYTEPISRQDVATAVGYNESYISHLFSDHLNTTLTDYITCLRIDDAKQLLTETNMTVSQIAARLGFGCIRSFNRAFIKETGLTPTDYRTQCR